MFELLIPSDYQTWFLHISQNIGLGHTCYEQPCIKHCQVCLKNIEQYVFKGLGKLKKKPRVQATFGWRVVTWWPYHPWTLGLFSWAIDRMASRIMEWGWQDGHCDPLEQHQGLRHFALASPRGGCGAGLCRACLSAACHGSKMFEVGNCHELPTF